jgi:hypothetical protein
MTSAVMVSDWRSTNMLNIQDALEQAGFKLNPQAGRFERVLAVMRTSLTTWRFGYSPAASMWRHQWGAQRVHADLSSSAVNKLDEALQTCSFSNGTLDVRACRRHSDRLKVLTSR